VGRIDAGQLQRHRDVFERGHGGNEMERLEHDADIAAAEARQGVLAQGAEGFPRDHDRTGVGALQPRGHHEQGGLARAGRTDQPDGLALSYMQVDVFENMNAGRAPSQR
jgi:hypothetical protein